MRGGRRSVAAAAAAGKSIQLAGFIVAGVGGAGVIIGVSDVSSRAYEDLARDKRQRDDDEEPYEPKKALDEAKISGVGKKSDGRRRRFDDFRRRLPDYSPIPRVNVPRHRSSLIARNHD